MEDDKAKKLAAEIRAADDSMELDLAGYGADQCDKLAAAAFATPLPLEKMVRFSFLVGGGKKVRQKYNDGLPQLWADALRKAGFTEDRGASLAAECAGLFKFQHNTDTDLKVIHVYPRIDPDAAAAAAAAAAGEPSEAALSPSELIIHAELSTFQRMIQAKTFTLAQRRRAHDLLKEARAELSRSEAKMAALEPLTDEEQRRYDTLDATVLETKQTWLGKQSSSLDPNPRPSHACSLDS